MSFHNSSFIARLTGFLCLLASCFFVNTLAWADKGTWSVFGVTSGVADGSGASWFYFGQRADNRVPIDITGYSASGHAETLCRKGDLNAAGYSNNVKITVNVVWQPANGDIIADPPPPTVTLCYKCSVSADDNAFAYIPPYAAGVVSASSSAQVTLDGLTATAKPVNIRLVKASTNPPHMYEEGHGPEKKEEYKTIVLPVDPSTGVATKEIAVDWSIASKVTHTTDDAPFTNGVIDYLLEFNVPWVDITGPGADESILYSGTNAPYITFSAGDYGDSRLTELTCYMNGEIVAKYPNPNSYPNEEVPPVNQKSRQIQAWDTTHWPDGSVVTLRAEAKFLGGLTLTKTVRVHVYNKAYRMEHIDFPADIRASAN